MSFAMHAKRAFQHYKKLQKREAQREEADYWFGIAHGVIDGPLVKLHKAGLCNNDWHKCPVCQIAHLDEQAILHFKERQAAKSRRTEA